MIPILYSPFETTFTSNGIGRLTECVSCTVTEERNGIYECEFQYPINGKFYKTLISQANRIGVIHDDNKDIQPFEIYRHSDPIDGIVTFNAHHISYKLANVIVDPFSAATCADALQGLADNAITQNDFTFWTDKNVVATFDLATPDNARALLCGQQGSILDVYGTGEYEFDKYTVKLYTHRGSDRGVTIRYGKNLADINRTYDESGIFNAVIPFWADEEGNLVMLPEKVIYDVAGVIAKYPWEESINGEIITDENGTVIEFQPFEIRAVPLDLSDQFEEQPTEQQLRAAAQAYLTNNEPWVPHDNIEVNFVQLWQTPEYESVAALQRVSLCDTVAVYYPEMGVVNATAKVIRIVYNVLTEQYDEMELGEPKVSLAQAISQPIEAQINGLLEDAEAFTEKAILAATNLITGGLGGYVVMNLNASGQPQEILIMDTDNINTAVNVIRMNKNGIGFSTTGYEGPYTSAWTIDGNFNADFITTGTMLANRIQGGTLTVGGVNNTSGVLNVKDASNNTVGSWDKDGIYIGKGIINLAQGSYIYCPIYSDGQSYAMFDNSGFILHVVEGDETNDIRTVSGYNFGADLYYLGLSGSHNKSGVSTSTAFSISPAGLDIILTSGDYLTVDWDLGFQYTNNNGDGFRYLLSQNTLLVAGKLVATGTKNRLVKTKEYSNRLLYCYETSSPMFGDVGEGVIDETGFCYIFLDPVFAETISTNQYQVFLQKYGQGDCWVSERKGGYFVVQGTAGLSFGWELKAKQRDYDQMRLEHMDETEPEKEIDYGVEAAKYLKELEEGRQTA